MFGLFCPQGRDWLFQSPLHTGYLGITVTTTRLYLDKEGEPLSDSFICEHSPLPNSLPFYMNFPLDNETINN